LRVLLFGPRERRARQGRKKTGRRRRREVVSSFGTESKNVGLYRGPSESGGDGDIERNEWFNLKGESKRCEMGSILRVGFHRERDRDGLGSHPIPSELGGEGIGGGGYRIILSQKCFAGTQAKIERMRGKGNWHMKHSFCISKEKLREWKKRRCLLGEDTHARGTGSPHPRGGLFLAAPLRRSR